MHSRNRDLDVEKGLVKQWGRERVGQMDRVALTYPHQHTQNKQAAGRCYMAQELSLVLCDGRAGWGGMGALQREGPYVAHS